MDSKLRMLALLASLPAMMLNGPTIGGPVARCRSPMPLFRWGPTRAQRRLLLPPEPIERTLERQAWNKAVDDRKRERTQRRIARRMGT